VFVKVNENDLTGVIYITENNSVINLKEIQMKTLVTLLATLVTVSAFATEPAPAAAPAQAPAKEMKLAKKVDHTKSQPAKSKAKHKDTKKAETPKK
jgi:hypothetical protein